MSKIRSARFRFPAVLKGVLFWSALFVFALVMSALTYLPWGNWRVLLDLLLFFAVLGGYYGTIATLDPDSEMAFSDSPIWRTLICGALAALAAYLVQGWATPSFDVRWTALSFLVGAGFGYLGWTWAKYVDF